MWRNQKNICIFVMISLLLCINIISHSLAHNILNLSSNISIYILNHTRIVHRQSKVSQYEKKISLVKRNKTLWNYYTKHKQKSAKCKSPGPEFHCNANPINSVLWDYLFVPSKIRIIFFSLCVLKCILSPYLFWILFHDSRFAFIEIRKSPDKNKYDWRLLNKFVCYEKKHCNIF